MVLHVLLIISQIASASGYCYSRNGTTLLNAAFQPCKNTTTHSACCMTNHSGAGDVGIADDVCMENGLCQNYAVYDGKNEGQQVWSRQGCTDPLWNSPYCLGDVCNKPEYADQWGNVGVWNCGGENWCCGEKSCCNDKSNIFKLAATVGPASTIPSATPSTTPSATPSSFASSSSTSPPTASPSSERDTLLKGLSQGAKDGIKAGISVFVVGVIAAVLLVFWLKKRNKRRHIPKNGGIPHTNISEEEKHTPRVYAQELYSNHGYGELGEREHAELATNNAPQELEARSGNVR